MEPLARGHTVREKTQIILGPQPVHHPGSPQSASPEGFPVEAASENDGEGRAERVSWQGKLHSDRQRACKEWGWLGSGSLSGGAGRRCEEVTGQFNLCEGQGEGLLVSTGREGRWGRLPGRGCGGLGEGMVAHTEFLLGARCWSKGLILRTPAVQGGRYRDDATLQRRTEIWEVESELRSSNAGTPTQARP